MTTTTVKPTTPESLDEIADALRSVGRIDTACLLWNVASAWATDHTAANVERAKVARLTTALEQWQLFGKHMMLSHRAQLPVETQDHYGGGCGCPQCERVRVMLEVFSWPLPR